jgi:hypothetical protein
MKKSTIALLAVLALIVIAVIYRPAGKGDASPASPAPTVSQRPSADGKPRPRDPQGASGPAVRIDEPYDKKLYTPVLHSATLSGDDGTRAYVRVPSTSSRKRLSPNQLGEFPPMPAGLLETVAARIDLPDSPPGTPVAVTILDGGNFPGEGESDASRLLKVEDWGGVEFRFTTSRNDGHHRLRVQPSGGRLKIIDFYATKNSSSENL